MRIGFTGSRSGMTAAQATAVREALLSLGATEVHHGDCLGSDEQLHAMATELALAVVIHPPLDPKHRAHCRGGRVLPPRDYLLRNHHIVDACEVLVATPSGPEKLRSGTWATVRAALRAGKRTLVVMPAGGVATASGDQAGRSSPG